MTTHPILSVVCRARDLSTQVDIAVAIRWLRSIVAQPQHVAWTDATNALGALSGSPAFDRSLAAFWLMGVSVSPLWSDEARDYARILGARIIAQEVGMVVSDEK